MAVINGEPWATEVKTEENAETEEEKFPPDLKDELFPNGIPPRKKKKREVSILGKGKQSDWISFSKI